jgi:hypothetical protein
MRIYTLHQPSKSKDAAAEAVPVKEGFSWPGFFFSVIWALWHRLWFWAIAFAVANIVLGWVLARAGGNEFVQSTASLAVALVIGWTANDLRRRKLAKQGFKECAVMVANNKETALARYLMAQPAAPAVDFMNRAGGPW